MIYHINYSNINYKPSQIINTQSAMVYACFDNFISLSPDDLPLDFKQQNKSILKNYIGAGYWLWKPFIVLDLLYKINYNDIVFYTDSGCEFIDNPNVLIELIQKYNQDIIPFELQLKNKDYTKRDTFILMNCDDESYSMSNQICSGYIVIKKTDFSISFFEEFLKYAKDKRIITNKKNTLGKPNYEGFIAHRHDQSIFSLLCKKHNLMNFRDPSQFGVDFINLYPKLFINDCLLFLLSLNNLNLNSFH